MKKLLCLLLAMVILFSLAIPSYALHYSDWAEPYVQLAQELDMIPESLKNADLTQNITRAEFAAVAVKLYEALTGKKQTEAAPSGSYKDCDDEYVRKALFLGIADGVGSGRFAPGENLTREQAATMLTRVFKKYTFPDWSRTTEAAYADLFQKLYDAPPAFADQPEISDWAVDSVRFMRAKTIIDGMGGNRFEPKGKNTREQAIKIAGKMLSVLPNSKFVPDNAVLVDHREGYDIYTWEENGSWVVAMYEALTTLVNRYDVPAVFSDENPHLFLRLSSYQKQGLYAWYFGSAGLYEFRDGNLRQVSTRPVKNLTFVRNGPEASGPIILTFDLSTQKKLSVLNDADMIINCDCNFSGEEAVLLPSQIGGKIGIANINAVDSAIQFYAAHDVGMGNCDIYTYALTSAPGGVPRYDGAVQIAVIDFQAGRPEVMDGFSYDAPEAYVRGYIQKEQQRLDELIRTMK